MSDLSRVTRVRNLLKEVDQVRVPRSRGVTLDVLFTDVALDRLTRRGLIAYIKVAAERLRLQDDLEAYLAMAGCASLSGLDMSQLHKVAAWIDQAMDRAATASDCPFAPPAS